MNYLVLISFLVLTFSWEFHLPAVAQLPDHQFVEINQIPEWEILPGERKNLEINIWILEGYHILAEQVQDDNLVPASLTVMEVPVNIIVYNPVFPEPISYKLKDAQDSISVFQKTLRIYIPVEVKKEAQIGSYKIEMNLQYQACDSLKCFSPRALPFMINVVVNERLPLREND